MWFISEEAFDVKRFFLFLLPLCLATQVAEAQELWKLRRYEVAAGLGATSFFGDVGGFSNGENALGFRDISILQTRTNIDFSAKYRILYDINARFSFSGGLLKATDERGSNEGREFEAATTFYAPTLLGEYYLIKNRLENSYGFLRNGIKHTNFFGALDIYVFSGIGGMFYSVKGNEKLESHANFRSGGFAVVLPVGIGSNYILTRDLNLGLELSGRYALSDYIDGYTSQYSRHNDVYLYLNVVITYKINVNSVGENILSRR